MYLLVDSFAFQTFGNREDADRHHDDCGSPLNLADSASEERRANLRPSSSLRSSAACPLCPKNAHIISTVFFKEGALPIFLTHFCPHVAVIGRLVPNEHCHSRSVPSAKSLFTPATSVGVVHSTPTNACDAGLFDFDSAHLGSTIGDTDHHLELQRSLGAPGLARQRVWKRDTSPPLA
ncbi:hypothetical protein DENSPDRAFT_145652 [Dentipellis sp. KUC8613]|nr:hypothetical protein DENSPDRAFT_145652 [Dentipellis sp. KUC8613]